MSSDLYPWDREKCTAWCSENETGHNHDPACWGDDHVVLLSQEEGFPREAVEPYDVAGLHGDGCVPTVGVYAYRGQPGYREVIYLHVYRPSDNEHLHLDSSIHLTGKEAVTLARHLLGVAVDVDRTLADLHD